MDRAVCFCAFGDLADLRQNGSAVFALETKDELLLTWEMENAGLVFLESKLPTWKIENARFVFFW